MRFNNKKETRWISSIYIIIVAVFITIVFAASYIKYDDTPFSYWNLVPNIIGIASAIYLFTVGRYYEFDNDGETLNFKSNGVLISKFLHYRQQDTEIPKSKLIRFKIENYYFYKRLHIYTSSRNKRGFRHYIYDITFLSGKKLKSMQISLHKVVENHNKALA